MNINKEYTNKRFNLTVVLREVNEDMVVIEKTIGFGYRPNNERVELTVKEFEILFLTK